MSRVEIIKAVGRDWIAGLTWRSFAEQPNLRERREDARSLGADWVVLLETPDINQAGFCPGIANRNPRRLYSLAAAIAEEYQQPWRGVFQLSDELWWYIAVRDGQAILPDGDIVGTHADILEARQRHDSYNDWNVHDGGLEDLLPLLQVAKNDVRLTALQSVESVSIWRFLAPAIVIIILLVGGLSLYRHHEHLLEQQRLQAMIRARDRTISPLYSMPAPDEWLAACGAVVDDLPISQKGWMAINVVCSRDVVSIVWERLTGATVASRPSGRLSTDGNKVVQVRSLGRLPSGSHGVQDYEVADDMLYDILQPINVQAMISQPTRDSADIYFRQDVSFMLPISPFKMNFDKVSGLRLTSLAWTHAGWALRGTLYAK